LYFFFVVDEVVIKVLNEGFHQAQRLFISCNMGLSQRATNKKWWTKPLLIESIDKTFMCVKPLEKPIARADGDCEIM
jgi:hypothetical protein